MSRFLERTRQSFLGLFQATQLTLTERCGRTCPPPLTPASPLWHWAWGSECLRCTGERRQGWAWTISSGTSSPDFRPSALSPISHPSLGTTLGGSEVGDKSWRPQKVHSGVEGGDVPQHCGYLKVMAILPMPWCLVPSTGLYFLKELNTLQFHLSAFLPWI